MIQPVNKTFQAMKTVCLVATLLTALTSAPAQTIAWPTAVDLVRQRADSVSCANRLKQTIIQAELWAGDNFDEYPFSFDVFTNELLYPGLLFCPANHQYEVPTNWADLDWATIDYEWVPLPDWSDPLAVSCRCLVHSNYARADGSVKQVGRYRAGWPAIIAAPLAQYATPGSNVQLQVVIAPDALSPVNYQWRQQHPVYVTNITYYPEVPLWVTNVTSYLVFTNLPGPTNATLVLPNLQPTNSDSYAVTVSNALGIALSAEARLWVDPSVPAMATNEYWSAMNCLNNLRTIASFALCWAADHDDHMPPQLSVMTNAYGSPIFGWPIALYCRSDDGRAAPTNWAAVNFDDTSYEVLPGDDQDPEAVFCRCKVHGYSASMDGTVAPRANFRRIRPVAPNARELTFAVWPGRTNVLEASTDLLTWTTLQEYSPTNGLCRFGDTNSIVRRFYRIRTP